MGRVVLRSYQERVLDDLRNAFREGHKRVMLYLATGGGKTECAISLLEAAYDKGNRAAMLMDRIVLVSQTSARLDKYGIAHGVMQSGHWRNRPYENVQVCSAQTLEKRGSFPGLKLLVIDEAHKVRKQTMEFLKNNEDVIAVGLSASPFAKGLASMFTKVVGAITTKELVDLGNLVPLRVFIAPEIDTSKVKIVAGEFNADQLNEAAIKLSGDVVAEWRKKCWEIFGGPRKTIVFSAGVAHGADLVKRFAEAGFNFVQLSYEDTDDFKREAVKDFQRPDTSIHGLVATDILTAGFDCPDVMVGVSARPFKKSFSSHVQQMGRVMRPSPGKTFALWLDHCIASGSRVLTQRGLVPIEKILITDTLWDGHEFVAHKGVVNRGIRPLIRYAGLTATADHPVKTREGWRSFGAVAEEQAAIVTTGVGRTALRERHGHFSAGGVAGRQGAALHACALRVRDVWLSIRDFVLQPHGRPHQGMQGMQPAEAVPGMAVREGGCDASPLHESQHQQLQGLRRQGDRVSIRLRDFVRSLDHGELAAAAECARVGFGPGEQRRPLRAWESSLGHAAIERSESARQQVDATDAQVQAGEPEGSLLGRHLARIAGRWLGLRGNQGAVRQALEEAEGQVWDILEAGPRNCFTCEGLLVHNSGNYLRFQDKWDDLYENGVQRLVDDGEKPMPERDAKEKERSKCPKCGALWSGRARICNACGFQRPIFNMVEETPGELVELGKSSVSRAERQRWYDELRAIMRARGKSDGAAAFLFKHKFGELPPWAWQDRQVLAHTNVSPEVAGFEHSRRIAFAKGRKAA